jgi:hypothetical protein
MKLLPQHRSSSKSGGDGTIELGAVHGPEDTLRATL